MCHWKGLAPSSLQVKTQALNSMCWASWRQQGRELSQPQVGWLASRTASLGNPGEGVASASVVILSQEKGFPPSDKGHVSQGRLSQS